MTGKRPVLFLASALLLACSCQKTPEPTQEVVRFSFWGSFIEWKLWEDLKARFEELHPDVELQLQYAPGEYGRKLRLQLISETACDIIMVDDEFLPTYGEAGHLLDLGSLIERDRVELALEDFLPTSLESFSYKGTQFGLPWDGFNTLCYYNKDLFDEAGLPYPSDDWTWQDFQRLAIALTRDLDGDGRIDQYGCNLGFGWLDVEALIWSWGGDILSPDRTRSVLNSPQNLEALTFLHDLKFKYHTMPQVGELSGMAREIQILTGRVAMIQAPAYILSTLRDVEAMSWDLAHMPTGPSGKASRVSWDGLAIYAKSQHVETAWAFIKLVLSPEGQRAIGKLQRAVPVRRSSAWDSFVDPKTPQQEEKFLEAMSYGRLTPITTHYTEMHLTYGSDLERLALGTASVEEVLRVLDQKTNEILNER